MPSKPPSRPHCYICGHTGSTDRPVKRSDHVPPKNLYPPEHRGDDMLKVDICSICHNAGMAQMDEAFYLWASMAANVSPPGELIRKKTLETLEAKPKIKHAIQEKFLTTRTIPVDGRIVSFPAVAQLVSRTHPYIRRITKGLLYELYPHYDYFSDNFRMRCIQLLNDQTAETINGFILHLPEYKRNDDVFKCWHSVGKESGLWVFAFYNVLHFVVRHGKDEWYKQRFTGTSGQNYKEHHSLPECL